MDTTLNTPILNQQQLDMLRLLKRPLSDTDYSQLRQYVVQLLGKRLDEKVEKWEAENEIDEHYYEELSKIHFRPGKSK